MNKKIAIVTGVSRLKGIGRAICCELAKKGADIFFTYWKEYDNQMPWKVKDNEPELILNEIRQFGVKCHNLELDLSLDNSYETLLNEVSAKLGTPSILINNATYSTPTNIDTLCSDELNKHYAVNLKTTTLLTVEFIKRFKTKHGGHIINITSGQSLSTMSEEIAYAITKGAIETLTHTLSKVAASKGITINAVNPGLTDTGWFDDKSKENWTNYFPMGRVGIPKDAANLVAFLASDDAGWITGQVIHSEGGFNRENYLI